MTGRLPRQDGCVCYVTREQREDCAIVSRIWMDEDSGRMCEFHIAVYGDHESLLASADCSHGIAHYHDERYGHGKESRRGDIGPVSTHDEIEQAYTEASAGIIPMCLRYGIIR